LKKAIALAIVIVAALLFAKFYQLQIIGFLENSTYVLTDNQITRNLMQDDIEPKKASVEPEKLEAMAPLYELAGSLYAGEQKSKLNTAYPLFVNDSAALLNINDSAKLITDDFRSVNSYYGLYVSDGVSFNADKERADAEEFILLELNNKMHINTKQMEVHTICGDVQIPMNGIINFQEDSIRYYTLSDGQFHYGRIKNIDEQALVRFDDREYPYFEFLQKLGKLNKGTFSGGLAELEPPLPDQPKISEPEKDEKQQEGDSGDTETPSDGKKDSANAKAPSYRKPRVSMSDFRLDLQEKLASTTLTIKDPAGALTGEIQVTLTAKDGTSQVWIYTDYTEAQPEGTNAIATFKELVKGQEYSATGTFTYLDKNGQKQAETFGPKTFMMEEKKDPEPETQLYYYEQEPDSPNKKPVITCEPFSADIYDLQSILTIKEQGSLVAGGIRFEVYRGERLYMRKSVSAAGEVKIGPLPPGTEYKVIGSFTYLDQYNLKVEEKILEQTISTLSLDKLAPMTLSFKNGKIFHDRIQLIDLSFADDPADSTRKVGSATIPYVAKIAVQIENSAYSLKTAQINKMQEGGKVEYETPAVLRSNREYEYTLYCYDRFGNELPLTAPAVGKTHTCKAPPKAVIRLTGNEVAHTELSVQIENLDYVQMQNCWLLLYDLEGNLVPAIIQMEDGGNSPSATQHALPENGGKIVFTNLPAGEVYSAVVYCDYDLDNGDGMQLNQEIGRTRFTTLAISALGYAIFDTTISELTDTSALLHIALDKNRTNQSLIFLLSKATITITAPDGEELKAISLTGDELQNLTEGNPLEIQLEHLLGATEYQITITAEVEQGSVIYDIKTSNKNDTFKTLKTEPQVLIPSYFAVSNSIELYDVLIDDPGETILSNVNLLVSDSYGRIVGMSILQANTPYERLSFPKLVEDETYTFTFIAAEFNNGYDYTTYRSLYQLTPIYQIKNENQLFGKIGLRSLDEIAGDTRHFNAKLRVEITDEKNLLVDNPRYIIKVFQEGEAADTLVREIEPIGSDVDTIFSYQVEALSEYRLELWVEVHDHEVKLAETSFTTEQRIIGLAKIQDFTQLGSNPTGKYIVLNDINLTAGPWNWNGNPFNGELDFQGHTLTSTQGYYLFYIMGRNGVLKNMVLDLTIPYNDPLRYRSFIAYSLSGRMQNIIVNVKGCTKYLHNNWGLFYHYSGVSCVVENFVINLESPLYAWDTFGCVAAHNNGTIRNGYIYGTDIQLPDIAVEGGYTASTFGGIVANNNLAGRVENVFNLVNIHTGTEVTPSKNSFGTIASINNGIVKGAFTTGEVYFGNNQDLRYGPAVGSEGGKRQTAACYISERSTYQNTYNTKATKETLYDPLWHQAMLGNAFEIEEPVLLGYYPRLKMPACMPAQAYLPLPELDVVNTVELASVMVEEQHEDYAIAVFTFKNPGAYNIKKVAVEYLNATVIEESQVDKDELSRVKVRLDNPTGYYSRYSVMYIGYSISASGSPIIRNYQKGERLVNAEFFKPIRTIEDWTAIQDSMGQNYRLKEDLDFNNVPQAAIRLGKSDGVQFTGKLDGGIYDEKEKLIGLRTIRNIDLSGGLGGVITNLAGSVSNLRAEKLFLESPTDGYVGFVRRTQSGALIDNVHLDSIRVQGNNMAGGIVGLCNYASVRNCSVNRLVLKDASAMAVRVGGIAGQASYSMIKNCYVYGLDLRIEKAKTGDGAGGILGYADYTEMGDCYAVGSIRTTAQNAGGLIGRANAGCILQNMWSDVDIVTDVDYLGGMVGFYSVDTAGMLVNTLVLGDLYSSVATAGNIRRIIGNSSDMGNGFAWSGQCINGEIPYEADGTTFVRDGAEILSGEQLRLARTYIKIIELGDSFDYTRVEDGILPQLYSTEGELLPYQTDHKLDENPKIEITDVTAQLVGNQYMIQVSISHHSGIIIENANFDYLHVNTEVVPVNDVSTILRCTVIGAPERYLDSYQLNGIRYNGGKVYSVLAQICFENPFYIDIPNVDAWQTVMTERRSNFENFRITGNLDFGNRPDIIYDVNVNRIVGSKDADGQYTTIRNISIPFADTSQGFINTVNASVSNLQFENITLTNKKGGGSNVGIIGKCLGNVEQVEFYNVNIDGLSASRVGCIGYSGGNITDVSAEDVIVKSTGDYVGGLVGQAYNSVLSRLSLSTKEMVVSEVSGRHYVGSLAGYVYGDISYSITENVSVTGTGNYVGGIAGYATPIIGGDIITNEQLSVKKAYIKGVNHVGGIVGQGKLRNNDNWSTLSLAEESIIIGTGGYVGGLMGQPGDRNRNGLVRNCQIFGGYNVGGIMGNSAGSWKFFVLDSTISTIYDPKYGELTGSAVPSPPNSTHNTNIGGVSARVTMGSGNISMSGAVNCIIGAQGADNVGGIYGYCSQSSNNFFCLDSTVYGRNNIGGLVGYHRACPVYNCQSNAEVIATGENAGGMSGYMYINRELDGTRVPRLVGNYYVGNVTAADYAGGLVGRTSAALSGDNSRLIVAANVTAKGSHGNIIGNQAGGSFTYLRIYNNSTLSVEGAPGRTAADIYASAPQSSAGMKLVTSVQLENQSTYTSLGSYFSTVYRNYTSLNYNYMPYLRYSGATMPYQEGKDETGAYNPVKSYRGGIPIPTGSVAPQMLTPSMMFNMAPEPQELPVPDFYAAGVDKLNIEFNKVNEYTGFIVSANGSNLIEQQIDQRVYTLDYDFSTSLKVTVTDGRQEQHYQVDPLSLRRNILTWDTDYYYITDLGVQSGKTGLLAGDFIHLYGGQGLIASGKICDLGDGSIIKENVAIALCEQVQPLYSFKYNDYSIKTYKNYSESNRGGETVIRELQLLVKNGRLAALDPTLPVVYDGVILDSAGSTEYMTVLGTDGILADLKEQIRLPKDFKNYDIVQMSNNIQCSAPYVLVRYQNGSVVAFNYLTGEILSVETVKSDISLVEYAKDFFKAKWGSVMSDISDGYLQLVKLEKTLSVSPSLDKLETGDKSDGKNTDGTPNRQEPDGEETDGDSAGGSAEDVDSAQNMGSKQNAESAQNIKPEEKANITGESTETVSQPKEVEPEKTNKEVKGSGKSALGETADVEATETAQGKTAAGDLAKPEPLIHSYVPVYDAKLGEYLLYEEKNLLEASEERLTSVNEQLKTASVVVKSQKKEQEKQAILPENNGILLLSLIAISIVALLLYIYYKKCRI